MVLHVLLAVIVYASLNAWREIFVDALCRVLWRQLYAGQVCTHMPTCRFLSGGTGVRAWMCVDALHAHDSLARLVKHVIPQFDFLANCDDCGVASVGRAEILPALRGAIKQHARAGWLLLTASCLLNVPWIVALQYVGGHLHVGLRVEPGSPL